MEVNMTVKINTKQIGLGKPINIHATVGAVDKADEMMITLLSLDAEFSKSDKKLDSSEAMIATLKKEREVNKKIFAFLQDVLKLSDKQVDMIKERVDYQQLGSYVSYVCNRIKGVPEDTYQKAANNKKKGPKGQEEKSSDQ